jgi:hypothetical protein
MLTNNPPTGTSQIREDDFWTFDAVEERLIEAMRLWWRSPGHGRWPFALDAPWHLMTRRTRIAEGGFKGMDLARRLQAEDDEEAKALEGRERRGSLSRDEVALRDETAEWLGWVAEDARRVVVAAIAQRAAGRTNVDWRRIKAALGVEIMPRGVYRRYTTAISVIARRLNAPS